MTSTVDRRLCLALLAIFPVLGPWGIFAADFFDVIQDAVFGFRAAGAALLSNLSLDRGAVVKWDPDAMKLR